MSGVLKKQNKMGAMQLRFFYLNNDYLIYKDTVESVEFKGVVDLLDVAKVEIVGGKTLNISTENGSTFVVECG